MEADWPRRWRLTAPESHVLYYRGGAAPPELMRLAITELVARRMLRIEQVEKAGRWRAKLEWALTDGPAGGRAVEPPLDVALELVRSAPWQRLQAVREGSTIAVPVEGVLVSDLRRTVRKRFRNLDQYRELHVAPLLVDRGLLELTRPRGRGHAAEFEWTEAGREADAQLGRWLELGRENLAEWTRSDPVRAAAFTREAGSAVLLLRDQYAELEGLSRREGLVAEGGGGEGSALPAGGHAHAHHAGLGQGGEGLDFGDLDFSGLDFGGLLDAGGLGDFGGGGDGGGGGGGNGGGGGG